MGIEVTKSLGESFAKYIYDLLDRHNLFDCNPSSTPITCATKLQKRAVSILIILPSNCSAIWALQYLPLTRPDMLHSKQIKSIHTKAY